MDSPRTFIPCITSFIAFVLGMLCLFAGTQRQCLPQADLLTIHLDSMTSPIFGSPDFLSVYPMSYCEGITEQIAMRSSNKTTTVTTIRSCSNRHLLFSFNPNTALTDILGHNPGLDWPSYLTDDFAALAPTSRTMAIFYVLGTGTAGLAILVKLFSTVANSGMEVVAPSQLEFVMMVSSVLCLGISSLLASVISSEFVGLVNRSGALLGITADHGGTFLAMSWSAVALQILGMLAQLVQLWTYRAEHCHCDWDEMEQPEPERKPESSMEMQG